MDSVLGLSPGSKGFVSGQSFILGPQELDMSVAGVVICKRDVVLLSPQAKDRRWTPDVSVDLGTKGISRR